MPDFNTIANHAGPLCVVLAVFVVNVLLLGIALRTACSMFNVLSGGRNASGAVPEPTLMGSMVMVFLTHLVTVALSAGLIWGASHYAASVQLSPAEATYYAYLASIPLSFVVLTVLLALLLPAPVLKAFLI